MQIPLEIVFEGIPRSEFVEKQIRDCLDQLKQYYQTIISCRVHLELTHPDNQGHIFHMRINMHGLDRDLVVSRYRHDKHAHDDVVAVLRDAFASMSCQLDDGQRRIRVNVNTLELFPHGIIEKMEYIKDYGFIRTSDERRVYFHLNSVVDDMFYSLEPGSEVRFVEHETDQGPQARSVHVLGKYKVIA